MLNKIVSALAIAGGISLLSATTALTPSSTAQEALDYQAVMKSDKFTLWNSGETQNVAFNVWKRPARAGGGFYYFLWKGPYAKVADRGNPEVVVFFDSNVVQANSEFLVDCYDNGRPGLSCVNPDNKPVHYRYQGSCIFPWQRTSSGSLCSISDIDRPGQF